MSDLLRITFMTTIGENVGDEFIRHGVKRILDSVLPQPYRPFYVNKHDINSLTEPRLDEDGTLGDKYFDSDVFIQTGAPVYWRHRNGQKSTNVGWHGWLWEDRILKEAERHPKFINLGAGSCMALKDGASFFTEDDECQRFVSHSLIRASLTTTRDPLATQIVRHILPPDCWDTVRQIACPAFLAGMPAPPRGIIALNFMPNGGHYVLSESDVPPEVWWPGDAREIAKNLRLFGRRVVFIAHDEAERIYMEQFREPGEVIFHSKSYKDYLDFYAECDLVVANRVHGAVAAAGCGVPSIIVGNDSRAEIGQEIGLPVFHVGVHSAERIIESARYEIMRRLDRRANLINLRDRAFIQYHHLLSKVFA